MWVRRRRVLLNGSGVELPMPADPMVGAACSLGAEDLRERLAAWHDLSDAALTVEAADDAIRLSFSVDQPMTDIARLVALESGCCPFYRFTIRVAGGSRVLEVDAGPDGLPAVRALLGLSG
jgi:hypothetical protein